uniref:Ig-like domain-containing protein n=1 Tax=Anopheles melas TaxID=34690 RepID=A0A182TMA9_9DIPT
MSNEDPSRVITRAEGENVTLKCRADARPPVTSFSWYKNVELTAPNTEAKATEVSFRLMANQWSEWLYRVPNMRMSGENGETLYLTQLERESAGSYACAASNTEGETRSSSLTLKIQCK